VKELNKYISGRIALERKDYIFVDEIQEIADFKLAIRSLSHNNYDI